MKVIFRVDASTLMGAGHVMRCLTLANELHQFGTEGGFITRVHHGHWNRLIKEQGYQVFELPPPEQSAKSSDGENYDQWLGVSWERDAEETLQVIKQLQVDWLVVDHYGLCENWHRRIKLSVERIFVIDDLANRRLDCDLLMDQTFGRSEEEYQGLVGQRCKLLVGSEYALLRPEFLKLRPDAIEKRKRFSSVKRILISMGANDPNNITELILDGLKRVRWNKKPFVDIVLGSQAPYLDAVIDKAQQHSMNVEVTVDADDMDKHMLDADLAIGAAGATSWERCCLGLPTVMMVLADNQKTIAKNLASHGVVFDVLDVPSLIDKVEEIVNCDNSILQEMSSRCFQVLDGDGVKKVCYFMGLT